LACYSSPGASLQSHLIDEDTKAERENGKVCSHVAMEWKVYLLTPLLQVPRLAVLVLILLNVSEVFCTFTILTKRFTSTIASRVKIRKLKNAPPSHLSGSNKFLLSLKLPQDELAAYSAHYASGFQD
jgi:hypothetical protein